jgi:hypothetical protein
MSLEDTSDYSYRFGYAVCVVFLLCFILMTCTVVNDAIHRGELEQVVPVGTATPRDSNQ